MFRRNCFEKRRRIWN